MPRHPNRPKTQPGTAAAGSGTNAGPGNSRDVSAKGTTHNKEVSSASTEHDGERDDRTESSGQQVSPPISSESNEPNRPRNARISKAERVLGLTAQDLASAALEARRRREVVGPTPTISVDSPHMSTQRNRRKEKEAFDPADPHHLRSNSQKSAGAKSGGGGCGGLQLPVERKGFSQVSSSTDLKMVENGSEVESDVDQSSVGDEGSARSSPYPSKKGRGRDRFKKILRPLTRSRSAGAGDRVPAYALFLRYQPPNEPSKVNRSTDDVMRNSAECTESEEETTDGAAGSKAPAPASKEKKDRFAFFRRSEGHSGHSSSSSSSTSSNAVLPSTETLQGWAKSFEKLLSDKYGLKLFREFLRREFSDENIEFWIECERYRHLNSEKQRITDSKRIFREYVAVQAPSEINVDSKTRETTEANLCRAEPNLFEAAQKRIEALMEKDSYPRFLQSDLFQRLLQQRQAADNSLRIT